MHGDDMTMNGASKFANDGPTDADTLARMEQLKAKYADEASKRFEMRPEGEAQFLDMRLSDRYIHWLDDPWAQTDNQIVRDPSLDEGNHCKYLVIGTGFAGLLFAARLIQKGVDPSEIRMVDRARGYGGTWYWNRFPGLACDIESYVYIPLLEELGWMPKHKYAYGSDIRLACEAMADKFQLRDKTFFGRVVKGLTWDDKNSQWTIATEAEGNIEGHKTLDIKADFVLMGPGLADRPKLPKLTGMDSFKGHSIHSSRWDYNYSGGSPDDVHPTMDKLKDKTIGVLGTGCTAIQIVPEIANWAKHVYVVQRTASSVELRENPPTDPTEFKTRIANKEGWQEDRLNNMTSFVHRVEPLPEKDLVNDELTHWENAYALAGYHMGVTMEEAPAFLEKLHRQDVPHTERIRGQVDTEVKDKETAEKLKFWYPSWCKRPAFKSDWYSSFNNPNVTLIDTDGRGVDRVTENGIVANGKEYPVDLLVFSTGYKVSLTQWSPGARGLMKIKGRDGIDMDEVYENWRTLHACCTHGFPNLFWPGPGQAGFTANQTYTLDYIAKHVAHIITTAEQKMSGERVVIEPTAEACEEWTQKLMSTAAGMAHAGGCLPNYFNAEGDLQREMQQGPEVMMKYARRSPWGSGAINYKNLIEDWRDEGNMKGLDIEIVA